MSHRETQSEIQSEVLNKINQGSIHMKPRLYFTLLWLLGIVASIAASLSIAYVVNIFVYIARIQTADTPAYGARQNLQESLASFPWWSIVLSVILVLIATWLMRSYSRIYRFKLRSIIIVFLTISCLLGIGMSYANIGHTTGKNRHEDASLQHKTSNGAHRTQ